MGYPELPATDAYEPFSYTLNAYHPDASMLAATRTRQGTQDGGTYLTFVSSTHEDREPSSDKYKLGVALLDDWRKRTASLPKTKRLLIYEGRNPFTGRTQCDAIANYFGESGLLKWYAHEYAIPAESGEPSRRDEFRVLRAQAYEMGDGIVDSGEKIIRAILGTRILPFLCQDTLDPRDGTSLAVAQHIFNEYLRNDARLYVPITQECFAEAFESYFDQKFRIDNFTDPGHPLVALSRAVTEPDRYAELLSKHPRLKRLADHANIVQETRTLVFARRALGLYFDEDVSVFVWTGLPHGRRLQRVLCQTGRLYDPTSHRPELYRIPGKLHEGTTPHPTIVPFVGTLSLRTVLDRRKHRDLWLPGTTGASDG